ncbi:RNA-binding protein 48 [Selaginella moellendorffii]|uniref:RNA-binding protein 48 n=1 Tax=Selaginella moellendorffii TaxID=88036 RepID=UPI000D1CA7FD|nr:RNA-binding protein 48 [Selaginella moellendorffii]|eukprot:XP_002980340.2 RNA-binding protein 48 [Selaginella moellendorffii]
MERAVKVYTVCDESRYMLVKNVPALGCSSELLQLLGSFGHIEEYLLLDDEECEPYTDVYWIKFADIAHARAAKRNLDDFQFFGNLLQVSYAPKYESLADTKHKLEARRLDVVERKAVLKDVDVNKRLRLQTGLLDPLDVTPLESFQPEPHFPLSVACEAPIPKHFSEPSMNATAKNVREKLDKLSQAPAKGHEDLVKPAPKKPRRRI